MAFDESRNNILQTSVRAQLFQLQSMDMDELSHKWRELFHTEPPDYGAVFMRRRLAHRIQELVYGGLSEEAKERIGAINTKISRKSNCLRSGTRIVREYHKELLAEHYVQHYAYRGKCKREYPRPMHDLLCSFLLSRADVLAYHRHRGILNALRYLIDYIVYTNSDTEGCRCYDSDRIYH